MVAAIFLSDHIRNETSKSANPHLRTSTAHGGSGVSLRKPVRNAGSEFPFSGATSSFLEIDQKSLSMSLKERRSSSLKKLLAI